MKYSIPDIIAWSFAAVCVFVLAVRICYTVREDRRRQRLFKKGMRTMTINKPDKDKNTIYIAGPMTGKPGFNHAAFNAAAKMLRRFGWLVKNPVEIAAEVEKDPEELARDPMKMAEVLHRELEALWECRSIYLLNGWERSVGAQTELYHALSRHAEIFLESECSWLDMLKAANDCDTRAKFDVCINEKLMAQPSINFAEELNRRVTGEPLPCPFCGGECKVEQRMGGSRVECECGYCSAFVEYAEKDGAYELDKADAYSVAAHNRVARAVMAAKESGAK